MGRSLRDHTVPPPPNKKWHTHALHREPRESIICRQGSQSQCPKTLDLSVGKRLQGYLREGGEDATFVSKDINHKPTHITITNRCHLCLRVVASASFQSRGPSRGVLLLHRWNRNSRPQPQTFSKLVFLI